MNLFLYLIIFIIGTFFGSFFTLAVYRIPRKEDILIKHSYCPNCNHKLGFFDLFPILSYLLLGGKCRYCENKIRPRYLILEFLSGITFLIIAITSKLNILSLESCINLAFLLIYISVLFIIAGIDKENSFIDKNVLLFGFVAQILYIIYQYTLRTLSVYQYVIYLIVFIIGFYILKISINNNKKSKYLIQVFALLLYIIIYSGVLKFLFTLMLTLIIMTIYEKIKNKKDVKTTIGFYLTISNIIIIITSNTIINYII